MGPASDGQPPKWDVRVEASLRLGDRRRGRLGLPRRPAEDMVGRALRSAGVAAAVTSSALAEVDLVAPALRSLGWPNEAVALTVCDANGYPFDAR
jgi:hypothetical protein